MNRDLPVTIIIFTGSILADWASRQGGFSLLPWLVLASSLLAWNAARPFGATIALAIWGEATSRLPLGTVTAVVLLPLAIRNLVGAVSDWHVRTVLLVTASACLQVLLLSLPAIVKLQVNFGLIGISMLFCAPTIVASSFLLNRYD